MRIIYHRTSRQLSSRYAQRLILAFVFGLAFRFRLSDFFLVGIIYQVMLLDEQVGLVGIARSLRKDLDKLAERADTSTPKGFRTIS